MQRYYPLEDQINACYDYLGVEHKNADNMTDEEINSSTLDLAQYFVWIPHPEYMQFVPKHIESGDIII